MARCEFVATDEVGVYRCQRCGFVARGMLDPPHLVYKDCDRGGAGDTLAWWIHVLTLGRVSPCAACNARRAWLNRLIPYGKPWRWWLARLRRTREDQS